MPLICMLGFGTLAFFPTVAAIVGFQVLRRSGEYAIVRPTREVLYTVVPREDRYKAKNFIDTVVYRGGDQVGAWTYAGFAALGLGLSAIALVSVALSALWLINGLWLGRKQEALAAEQKS
jgi:AAA family ATP:ADP antiporter